MAEDIKNWTVDRLADLSGKTYVITGANSGIGFEAARHLRAAGADVVIAARSVDKSADAISRLHDAGSGALTPLVLDLASMASIRAAADTLHETFEGLDAVINNAGVMQPPKGVTEDGFELQFGTNHLGHFLLNYLLYDLLVAKGGRIVPVSSVAHRQGSIDFDDLMSEKAYSATGAYGQSKLANIMYGFELARRLEAASSPVISVTCHPGYSATNLQSSGPTGFFKSLYKVTNLVAQSAADGAVPEVLAAAGAEARNGAYCGPTRFGDSRGPVGESTISKAAKDEAQAAQLWSMSEQLLGVTWTF